MKYCSECGCKISSQWVAHEGRERHICAQCGTTHYENPRIIVCCTVCCGEKVLMCRRSQEPAAGQWTVPSGFLEFGETLEEGAARETFEETGVIVDPNSLELHSVINIRAVDQVAIGFRIEFAFEPPLRAGAECLEVAFLSEREMPVDQMAWRASMGDAPDRFFKELRIGEHTIRLTTLGSDEGQGYKSREYKITRSSPREIERGSLP